MADKLDQKADGVLTYFGVVVGGLAVYSSLYLSKGHEIAIVGAAVGVLFLIAAAGTALFARTPTDCPVPPRVPYLLNKSKDLGNAANEKLWLALQYNRTTVAVDLTVKFLGRRIRWSYRLLVAALLSIVIALLVQLLKPYFPPSGLSPFSTHSCSSSLSLSLSLSELDLYCRQKTESPNESNIYYSTPRGYCEILTEFTS